MSPTPFNNTLNIKKEPPNMCPSPLKVHKDSHFIKKSSPSSSSSSSINGIIKVPQRRPVIIYTHSPKIIHTHPRNFMALVQKLTGLSKSEEDQFVEKTPKIEPVINDNINPHATQRRHANQHINNYNKNPNKGIMNDDNESTSVITDENGSNSMGDGQVNSCFAPPIFDHAPNPCFNNIPFFTPNSYDLLCSTTQPYYNYPDSMFYMPPMRNSISSSTLEGLKEFPEF